MSLDLTGINNENEYYSHHYLSAIFEGNLKDTFSQWQTMAGSYRESLKAGPQKSDPFDEQRAPSLSALNSIDDKDDPLTP
ncbi:MAG: hypothetical protein WC810_27805 [Janthinobacterium sp.]|jgi:hypothetical protein